MIRTRFAPSPTGDPHIGNIRSALFAYLFAKKQSETEGEFLLRIEDTDRERHNEGSIAVIQEALDWLQILPENQDDPMIQSERLEIYKKAVTKLIEQGDAYVCNCSKDRLEEVRADQRAKKLPPMYDKKCRDLGLPLEGGCVVRMKIPMDEKIGFDDLVRGHVEFDTSTIDDQVLLKSDGFPTYHMAHVIDDAEMEITHVIRAEEWLPSTPKHIILNHMLGLNQPTYAHLPVILSPTKGKLSKRDGAVGILEYKKLGYLPEAIINFMILLGWNPKDDNEFLIDADKFNSTNLHSAFIPKEFNLAYVNKAPAVFDINKLNHFNEIYLKQRFNNPNLSEEHKSNLLSDFGVTGLSTGELEILGRGGFITLSQMADFINRLREQPSYDPALLIFKKSDLDKTKIGLNLAKQKLEESVFDEESLQETLSSITQDNSLSNGDVFWPVRVALSGQEKSPSPVELLIALGKDESINRIQKAIELLEK